MRCHESLFTLVHPLSNCYRIMGLTTCLKYVCFELHITPFSINPQLLKLSFTFILFTAPSTSKYSSHVCPLNMLEHFLLQGILCLIFSLSGMPYPPSPIPPSSSLPFTSVFYFLLNFFLTPSLIRYTQTKLVSSLHSQRALISFVSITLYKHYLFISDSLNRLSSLHLCRA